MSSSHLYDDDFTPPDMSDPDMAFAHAVDVIEEVNSWGDYALTGIPSHIENATQQAWSIVYAWESFMLDNLPRASQTVASTVNGLGAVTLGMWSRGAHPARY